MTKRAIRVVTAVIVKNHRYLVTQRTETAVLPLLWEFPGGRVEPDETDAAALQRTLRNRLGVEVAVSELMSTTEREYENYVVHLHLYRCSLVDSQPQALRVRDFRWSSLDDIAKLKFPPADQHAMDALLLEHARTVG